MSWPTVSLDRCIASIRAGVSISGESRAPGEGEVGILTLSAVSGGLFSPDRCKAIPADAAAGLGDPVKAGTLLMTRSNTIDLVGTTALVEEDHPNRFLPDLLWEITLREDSPLSATFLVDYLATSEGRALLQSAAMGTSGSMKKLSMKRVRALKVPQPPPNLQRGWGMVRQRFVALDGLLNRQLAAKRSLKLGLARDLLTGRRRFPGFSHATAWHYAPLGDVGEGVTRRNTDDSEERVLTCSGQKGLVDQREFFSKIVAGEFREDYFLLRRGEFAYNRSSMTGYPFGAIKRLDRYDAGVLSTLNICFALRGDTWDSDFATHYFESGLLNEQLGRITRIGSRAHGLLNVTKADFFALKVPVPAREEQSRIAAVLNAIDKELALLERERVLYASQRRGLMRNALSRDRIINADATPEPVHA